MQLLKIIKYIVSHPLGRHNKFFSVIRFIFWQFRGLITSKPYVYQFTPKSKLSISKGMKGATGNIYTGLHEFVEMGFLLHLLRPEDLFVDVGANVGTYTILASAQVGAKTFCFEPSPSTFFSLEENIKLNKIESKVIAKQMGISKEKNTLFFTNNLDVENHIENEKSDESIEVDVDTLDNLIKNEFPVLIKIDVEGFETDVLNGAKDTLSNLELKAIIIELIGLGEKYGFDETEVRNILSETGFCPYEYNPMERSLTKINSITTDNTIYIRDIDFVSNRIKEAKTIKILNSNF